MPPGRKVVESRGLLPPVPTLSLRAKGVASLAVPIAALFAAMFAVYWSEQAIRDTEDAIRRTQDAQKEILQLRILLLNGAKNSARDAAIRASFERLRLLVADPRALSEIRRSVETEGTATAAIGERLDQLYRREDRRLAEERLDREDVRRRLFHVIAWCGIIGPFGALAIHLIIVGRVVKRLREVEENARRLAHGLPLQPFSQGTDEISTLGRQVEDTAYLLRNRERELRESERRYRDLFDQAPVPYEETDREGVIRRFNQEVCRLLGCGPDHILGSYAWDFIAPDQKEALRAAMLDRIETGQEAGASFECDYLREDGSCITVEVHENLIRNDDGEVTGVCRSLLDVTERNLAAVAARKVEQYAMELRNKNEQLVHALAAARSATEAKSRFLASVSHELRTPLNGIIGFSEVMYDGKVGEISEIHREFLGDILTSARHLLQLINDVLDISKVEAGKMEFRPEPCDVGALVNEVRDVVSPLARKKTILLTIDVSAPLTAVIDASRFKQVLYNYLSNAVKFTPENGRVDVRLARIENNRFRLEVEDSGVGIAPEEVSLLFQEFQQLPSGQKAEQGTGLGLALTRRIVEAQGGSVAVSSTPGKGSVFSAVLPISTPGNGTGDLELIS